MSFQRRPEPRISLVSGYRIKSGMTVWERFYVFFGQSFARQGMQADMIAVRPGWDMTPVLMVG
uniref:Uncharacterized protein n=1 Tax=uncultured Desulfobacterium sp. TaxID=201089 RepID=E1YLA2_9BACT|nr:unknown protein [uncultured Desulfobacterium sp.]